MKTSVYIFSALLAVSFLCSCSVTKLSKSGDAETKFVKGFLQHMVDNTATDSEILRNYISPEFLKDNSIDISSKNVNVYYPNDFSIEKYERETGMVTVKIWGSERSWVHQLTFKVQKIDGKLYLYGKPNSESYVDPWYNVEAYIKE